MHTSAAAPYVWMAVGIYLVDRIIRALKTRYTTARLTAIPDMGMTRVEIPTINAGWRSGQHVRLQVLSKGMGRLGWAEVHPFTVASVSQVRVSRYGPHSVVLIVRVWVGSQMMDPVSF